MLNFKRKRFVLILLLLFKMIATGRGASLKPKSIENENFKEKKLTKRGHFGSDNDYGPPIHISSDLLHLEDTPHIKEPTIIYQGLLSQHLPIWNDVSTEWQPVHIGLQTTSDEHFSAPTLGDAHETISHGGSLHTHIIGSSTGHGHNTFNLDDKLDISNNIDTKEKYYIKSYG